MTKIILPVQSGLDVTDIYTQLADHEARLVALEGGTPEPPDPGPEPSGNRPTGAYWPPTFLFDDFQARNVPVMHCWYDNWSYLDQAAAAGQLVDYELAMHHGGGPSDVTARLQRVVDRGHRDTLRYVMMIDEPDLHPAGTWDMNKFRQMYHAAHEVGEWPVYVVVRAHSSTWNQATPWFGNDPSPTCDVLAWDPYLAHYGSPAAENFIRSEGARIRAALPAGKPLVCVVQAGIVPWAVPPGTTPSPVSADMVRKMGLAALEVGATGCSLWYESDLPDTASDPWPDSVTNIQQATDAWDAYVPPADAPPVTHLTVPFHRRTKPWKPRQAG